MNMHELSWCFYGFHIFNASFYHRSEDDELNLINQLLFIDSGHSS